MKSTFDSYLSKDEKIIWEDSPRFSNYKKNDSFSFDSIIEVIGIIIFTKEVFFVVLAPIGIACFIFYLLPLVLQILLTILIVIYLYNIKCRISRSKYAISNQKIYIQIYNWWRTKDHILYHNEIGKASLEIYKNGSGIIHLLPSKPLKFRGKAILTGLSRHYPTIEMVKDIEIVHELLNKQLNKGRIY